MVGTNLQSHFFLANYYSTYHMSSLEFLNYTYVPLFFIYLKEKTCSKMLIAIGRAS